MFRGRVRHVHFVGVGGIGMSGIAEILRSLDFSVSGSDLKESDVTKRLEQLGVHVDVGHRASNVRDADVVVISSAVRADNPEVSEARARQIPVIQRAEMLAELMRLKHGVAIAGSHGKTTTTSLVATVLRAAGLDPTVVVGGKVNALGSNARLGQGDILVAEADESDGSFLRLTPTIAVVTNIDPEHLDHYGTHDVLKEAFVSFVERVPFYGLGVLCLDHPHVQAILPRIHRRHVTYGLSAQADYRAAHTTFHGLDTHFDAYRRNDHLGAFSVKMPGAHNVLNTLAAIAVADELEVPLDVVRDALASFGGVQRRFTIVGEARGVTLVDDYGHHPAEIEATLDAARRAYGDRRVVVAFQPHRYTRTQALLQDFARAFNRADVVLVTEIYAGGEDPIPGVTGKKLAEQIKAHGHHDVTFVPTRAETTNVLERIAQPRDIVICLGAGDINKCARELLSKWTAGDDAMSKSLLPSNRRVVSMREIESNVRITRRPEKPWDPSALWRTLKTIGRVALAVAILGVGIFAAIEARRYVTTSPRFGLKDLRVTYGGGASHPGGAHHHTPEQIAELAGVTLGQNVVEIDLELARQKLESDPWIERATITRRLPASVTIDVVEREAAAIVALPTGTYLSTAEGALFKKLDQADPIDLPIVTGLTADDAGGDREATAQLVRRALDLAKEIEHVGLFGGRVQELNVDRDGGVTAVIGKKSMRVVFGRGPYRPKVRLGAKIEAELIRRGARATTIFLDDDTHAERIVVRLVSALPPAQVIVDDEPPPTPSPSNKKVVANKKAKGGAQP